jgi:hypothetical protein
MEESRRRTARYLNLSIHNSHSYLQYFTVRYAQQEQQAGTPHNILFEVTSDTQKSRHSCQSTHQSSQNTPITVSLQYTRETITKTICTYDAHVVATVGWPLPRHAHVVATWHHADWPWISRGSAVGSAVVRGSALHQSSIALERAQCWGQRTQMQKILVKKRASLGKLATLGGYVSIVAPRTPTYESIDRSSHMLEGRHGPCGAPTRTPRAGRTPPPFQLPRAPILVGPALHGQKCPAPNLVCTSLAASRWR